MSEWRLRPSSSDTGYSRHRASSPIGYAERGIVIPMALITRVYLVDDLDGSEDDVSTVTFTLDGKDYEIDLSAGNADRLRGKLAKFTDAASPVRTKGAPSQRNSRAARPRTSRDQTQAVRDWARSNGHEVSDRGRISRSIQEAFDAAH